MGNLHAKYEIPRSYPSWDIVFTSVFQDFHHLTSGDPKWPLTSTKNDRDLLLNMGNLHAKYEIPRSYPSWDIVFTSIFQDFHHLTSSDRKWPLTSTKNNRDHLLNVSNEHAKYEIPRSYPSWYYSVYNVLTIRPLVTPNDLWPPPKLIGIISSVWAIHLLRMRSPTVALLEIQC